ncbi:MAG: glycosyltransferase, partial [Duncaniella sp.]|nr:glycosyltransferase [Duncaniella sp.]
HQGFPTYYVASKVKARRKIAWINADIVRDSYSENFNLGFYALYNKVVTASPGLRDLLLDAWDFRPGQLIPIRDIVSPAVLHRLAEDPAAQDAVREEADDQDSDRLRLLTVGRLVPVKGYDLLIGAAAILKTRGLAFRWDIIGDGPLREEIQKLIRTRGLSDNVRLLGALDNPYPLMRRCDIYVQPSRSEGYGIAVCEARAFCRPVIVTAFKVASGLVNDGTDGLICGMDAESLADAVSRLSSPQLRENFAARLAGSPADNSAESLGLILGLLN